MSQCLFLLNKCVGNGCVNIEKCFRSYWLIKKSSPLLEILCSVFKMSDLFSTGSGRVPDQLVNLDMKHGVEAKNYEEVDF